MWWWRQARWMQAVAMARGEKKRHTPLCMASSCSSIAVHSTSSIRLPTTSLSTLNATSSTTPLPTTLPTSPSPPSHLPLPLGLFLLVISFSPLTTYTVGCATQKLKSDDSSSSLSNRSSCAR